MKTSLFLDAIKENYLALMKMLEYTITLCSDELWSADSINPKFWQEVYHTIYYLDYYFNDDWKERPNHFEIPGHLEKMPETVLSKEDLQAYLDEVRKKCINLIDNLTDNELQKKDSFYWTGGTLSHRLIYNIRHSQHHIGKINFILRSRGLEVATWVIDSKEV